MTVQRTPQHEQELCICNQTAAIISGTESFSAKDAALFGLTAKLRLPRAYSGEVGVALYQHKDKLQNACFPFAYLRKCVLRQIRADEADRRQRDFPDPPAGFCDGEIRDIDRQDYAMFQAAKKGGRYRGDGFHSALKSAPGELIGPDRSAKWDAIARRVGLSADETQLIKARDAGISEKRMVEHLGWDARKVERISKAVERKFDAIAAAIRA